MANPQLENGYTQIANELLEFLYKRNLSPYEMRLFLFILRKTWGFKKKTDIIASRQFKKEIGLDRRIIHKVLKRLINKNIIVTSTGDKKGKSYGIQKDFDKWNLSPLRVTKEPVTSVSDSVSPLRVTKEAKVSPLQSPTKEKKETIQKKEEPPFSLSFKEKIIKTFVEHEDGSISIELLQNGKEKPFFIPCNKCA